MEELLAEIHGVQKLLYDGFKDDESTNQEWLNETCSKFSKLFKILHKFLIFDVTNPCNKNAIIESCFLCSNQIVVCLTAIEKTLIQESELEFPLNTARQCFSERLLWCLARLKSEVQSVNDNVVAENPQSENFIFFMDLALGIVSDFINIDFNASNLAEQKSELMIESTKMRSIIDQLLSHSLAFTNIALTEDKIPLTTLAQCVLKECMEFSLEFSLAQPGKKQNQAVQKLKAVALENSLYSLENQMNNCLLRLVFKVFDDLSMYPITKLRIIDDPDVLETEIDNFDLLIDRLIAIGLFAVSFSKDDSKTSSILRSCLASIESLDSFLIPAITSKADPSITILQQHFDSEVQTLQFYIQQIIDSSAFCVSLMEQLDVCIKENNKNFDKNSISMLIQKSNVMLNHLEVNKNDLNLHTDKVVKFYFNDFKLMLKECYAILNFPEEIENVNQRILKRLNILYSTLSKLQKAIKLKQQNAFQDEEKSNKVSGTQFELIELPSKCSDYFNTIRPSALGSILYESKRSIKIKQTGATQTFNLNTTRKSQKKRHSLRIQIFKQNHIDLEETPLKESSLMNDTLDLQITNILEQLTDLSTTLSRKD